MCRIDEEKFVLSLPFIVPMQTSMALTKWIIRKWKMVKFQSENVFHDSATYNVHGTFFWSINCARWLQSEPWSMSHEHQLKAMIQIQADADLGLNKICIRNGFKCWKWISHDLLCVSASSMRLCALLYNICESFAHCCLSVNYINWEYSFYVFNQFGVFYTS